MKLKRLLVVGSSLAALLALVLAADAPPTAPEIKATANAKPKPKSNSKSKPAVVPFELLPTNHMMVRARINGKGPFRLVFDLGAPITMLSNRAGEASGVVAKDAPKALLFSMRGEAEAETLEVGGLVAKDLPVIVFDHPALRALGGRFGRPLDGIIGFTLFARYRTTIDYQAREMTFEPVDFKMRDLLKDLPDRLAGPKVARRQVLAPAGVFGLTVAAAAGDGLGASGVSIVTVLAGSPADRAGLKPGDVLTSLDGRWTPTVADTFAAASTIAPGRAVEAVVVRDGRELTVRVAPKAGI